MTSIYASPWVCLIVTLTVLNMNERIKELADEAAVFSAILALPTGESGDKLFVERFTQLIVMECTKILADNGEFRACVIIGKHFGVEE